VVSVARPASIPGNLFPVYRLTQTELERDQLKLPSATLGHSQSSNGTFQHMSSPSELEASQTVIRGKYEPQLDAAAVRIVHCSADSSSTDTMSRRQQVVQAVRRPVRNGSRHCVNVLKELLPQEVSTANGVLACSGWLQSQTAAGHMQLQSL
jgi:hypothetical protein